MLFDVADLALSSNGKSNSIPGLKGVDENLESYEAGCPCNLDNSLSICNEPPEEETGWFTNTSSPAIVRYFPIDSRAMLSSANIYSFTFV